MNTKKNTLWIALSVLLIAAFVLSACGGGATPAPARAPDSSTAPLHNPQQPRRSQPLAQAVSWIVPWRASSRARR